MKRARLGKGGELDGVDEQGSGDEEEEVDPPRRSKKARAAPMFTTVPAAEDAEVCVTGMWCCVWQKLMSAGSW